MLKTSLIDMHGQIKDLQRNLENLSGKVSLLKEQKTECDAMKKSLELHLDNLLKAREVVSKVAQATQEKIEYHISNLVTMALASVFPDPWKLQLRFVERRNKTEADLIFIKGDNETDDLLNAGGGGPADIAAFALRIALWRIRETAPIMILDEPMRFVSRDLQPKVSALLKELSDKLGIQFIIVSHIPELCECANKIIEIENVNGESIIEED